MKNNARLVPLMMSFLFIGLVGCDRAPQSTTGTSEQTPQQLSISDNSQNALDWSGVYKGIIPCASCEGIKLSLQLNSDNSYHLTQIYLGKDDQLQRQAGSFKWNSQGSQITLDATPQSMQFQVGENQLFMLDIEGNRISGELAANYRLTKVQ